MCVCVCVCVCVCINTSADPILFGCLYKVTKANVMNFVVWPGCVDKRSRSVHTLHTVNNLMHNAMQIQPLVLGSYDTIAVSWKLIVC